MGARDSQRAFHRAKRGSRSMSGSCMYRWRTLVAAASSSDGTVCMIRAINAGSLLRTAPLTLPGRTERLPSPGHT